MRNYVLNFHPITISTYFSSIIIITFLNINPMITFSTLLISFITLLIVDNVKSALISVAYGLPLILFFGIFNTLTSTRGNTILLYLNSRAITLESLFYGLYSGIFILSTILLFKLFHILLGSGSLIYLINGKLPQTAIILTMIARFIPHFRRKLMETISVQQLLGVSIKAGTLKNRARSAGVIFSSLMSNLLENSMQTSVSMNARGFSLQKKTSAEVHKFCLSDALILTISLLILSIFLIQSNFIQKFTFYPTIISVKSNFSLIILIILNTFLMLVPLILFAKEEIQWKLSTSRT